MASGPDRSFVAGVRDATEQRRLEEERVRYAQGSAVEEIVAPLDAIVWESTTPDRESLSYLGGREEMLLGYPRARWLDPGFWMSLVHPDDRLAALTSVETAHETDAFELEYRVVAADGAVRDVRDAVTVMRGSDGGVERLRGVIIDITERREIADRLTQAQKVGAVGQLAGGIAHDFNNLLTIVSGYAHKLKSRTEMSWGQAALDQIVTAADRAAELTPQPLAFARRGQSAPRLQHPGAVVRELEPMLRRPSLPTSGLTSSSADGLPQVQIDRTAFEQIMMNLMLNAADAMSTGGTLTVAVHTREADGRDTGPHGVKPGRYVRLLVTDTGDGMPPEIRERIFEPFFSTKGERGTRMGLATAYGSSVLGIVGRQLRAA